MWQAAFYIWLCRLFQEHLRFMYYKFFHFSFDGLGSLACTHLELINSEIWIL
jgi:hypothetical protein